MYDYQLLDSGDGHKLEKIGPYTIIRPAPSAVWKPVLKNWKADAVFIRDKGWTFKNKLPPSWVINIENIQLKIECTDFGHLGVFPEHSFLWEKPKKLKGLNILNLFAYTGAASIFFAKNGAKVCHVDSSRPAVLWAKENSKLNGVENIRWIIDDAQKFLKREIKRKKYDGIVLDPPTFGRGARGEIFKIERDIFPILSMCKELLVEKPSFLILSSHSPNFSKTTLKNLLEQVMQKKVNAGELFLGGKIPLPSGNFAMWER